MSFELIAVGDGNKKRKTTVGLSEGLLEGLPEDVACTISEEMQKTLLYGWIKDLGTFEKEGSLGGYERGGSVKSTTT